MSRWKELPDSLDQRVRQLVVQLRRLKDRSGLSLVALEARTGYSRSSWERYLNGKALPPRHAVEELARATGTEPTRLLVLHEVAEEAWQQRVASSSSAGAKDDGGRGAGSRSAAERAGAADGPAGSAEESAESTESAASAEESVAPGEESGAPGERSAAAGGFRPPGVRGSVALAAVVAAALVGLGTGTLIPAPWRDDDGRGDAARAVMGTPGPRPSGSTATATQGPGRYVFQMGKSYPCEVREGRTAGGGLGAGYSTTGTAVLAGPGWDVVEAQCLLRHHKLDPGTVDGVYGQRTIAAVARLQKRAGLPADGIVGPHTWQVLRR
ncbi:peptidoglycan-binding protein [Streptomyces hygroscopicus]|uniref:peptidoglycan-binding protein n=1 Tax=Streptomyces hygroscopicus TaxID=1912 RepID=UPI00368BBBB1